MKYSIITISYNNSEHVHYLLQSLSLIDYPADEYEIIFVDDGSSPSIEQSNSIDTDKIRYIYNPRTATSSRSKARNVGASQASGDYLVFIDSDCLVPPEFLKQYDNYFNQYPHLDVALGGIHYLHTPLLPKNIDENLLAECARYDIHNKSDYRYRVSTINNGSISQISTSWVLFLSGNCCIKASVFSQVGKFEERFIKWGSEDTEIGYRLYKSGYKFELAHNKVFHISDHNDSHLSFNRYQSWIGNIGIFYDLHKDPEILLLLVQEKMLFDYYCLEKPWSKDLQISTFESIKTKAAIINPR